MFLATLILLIVTLIIGIGIGRLSRQTIVFRDKPVTLASAVVYQPTDKQRRAWAKERR